MSSSQTGATCEGLFVTVSVGQSHSADSAAVLRGAACLPGICSSWFCQVPLWARPTERILPEALLWWGTSVPTMCLAEQDQQSVSCQALLWWGIAIPTTSLWGGCHHHKHEKPALKQEHEELKLPLVTVILYTHLPVQDSLLTTASAPYVQWCNVLIAVPSPPHPLFPCDVFARSGFLYLPSKTFFPQGQQQHEVSGNNQPCMEDMHQCVSVKLSCKSLIQHACCAVQSNAIRVPCKDWLGDFVHGPARSVRCAKHIVFCTTTNRLICTHTLCSSFPVWATGLFRKDWLHPCERVDSCECALHSEVWMMNLSCLSNVVCLPDHFCTPGGDSTEQHRYSTSVHMSWESQAVYYYYHTTQIWHAASNSSTFPSKHNTNPSIFRNWTQDCPVTNPIPPHARNTINLWLTTSSLALPFPISHVRTQSLIAVATANFFAPFYKGQVGSDVVLQGDIQRGGGPFTCLSSGLMVSEKLASSDRMSGSRT